MGQDLFWDISLWVARMIMPACDSGLLLDANEASEKATNLTSLIGMGWNLMVTSEWTFASWRILLPSIKVEMVALLI